MADEIPSEMEKFKLQIADLKRRKPEWFKGQEAVEVRKGPKTPDLGPSRPIVEAPKRARDHDDGARNDV